MTAASVEVKFYLANPEILFVDARRPYEFQNGHIPAKNIINIPFDEIKETFTSPDNDFEVFCSKFFMFIIFRLFRRISKFQNQQKMQ